MVALSKKGLTVLNIHQNISLMFNIMNYSPDVSLQEGLPKRMGINYCFTFDDLSGAL